MKTILAIIMLMSSSSFAATTGTLLLQGFVPQLLNITVTSSVVSSTLDLSVSQTNLAVANVNEKSNSNTGYKVTFTSANGGKLKRVGGTEVVNYTMRYNGVNVGLVTPTVFTSAGVLSNVNKNIDISYVGVPNISMASGTYNDIITLNIAAN